MKLSESFFYTLREDQKDEESTSGNLLVKSGMFKKIGNGIYMKMPLGQKVAENVKNIVRITVGKKVEEGLIEIKKRNEEQEKVVPIDSIIDELKKIGLSE